jgi:hypothetical protein
VSSESMAKILRSELDNTLIWYFCRYLSDVIYVLFMYVLECIINMYNVYFLMETYPFIVPFWRSDNE